MDIRLLPPNSFPHLAAYFTARFLLALSLAAALGAALGAPPTSLVGEPAPASAATRSIVVKPDTTSVNVTGGDVVTFIAGERQFTWNFDSAVGIARIDLNQIAPYGTLNRPVAAYIAPRPLYDLD